MPDKLFARFREGERIVISNAPEPVSLGVALRTYWEKGAPIVVVKTEGSIAHVAAERVQHLDRSVAFLNDKINALILELFSNDLWSDDDFPTDDIRAIELSLLDYTAGIEHLYETFDRLQRVVELRKEVVDASRSV
jgi:hypothetical protein